MKSDHERGAIGQAIPGTQENPTQERQRVRCAPFGIANPSTCGQGYSPAHVHTSQHNTITQEGFGYSHTTVITSREGVDYAHHTYKMARTDWAIGVSILPCGRVEISSGRVGSARATTFAPSHIDNGFGAYVKRKAQELRREIKRKYANHTLEALFLFSGMVDYWGGDGERWDDDKGCLFAPYDHTTTVRDMIDAWVADFEGGGDCDSMPEWITALDVREALLNMLSPQGVKDYHEGALAECAENCEPCEEEDCDCELPQAIILLRYVG
jgi:hypothetical protein